MDMVPMIGVLVPVFPLGNPLRNDRPSRRQGGGSFPLWAVGTADERSEEAAAHSTFLFAGSAGACARCGLHRVSSSRYAAQAGRLLFSSCL